MIDKIEELLYKSLDQPLNSTDERVLTEALAESERLRLKLSELRQMRHSLEGLLTSEVNYTTIENTLQLVRQDDFNRSLTTQFKRLMIAASVIMALFSVVEFMVVDGNSFQDALSENTFVEAFSDNIINVAYGENL
jgi:hypothetical protein